MKKIFWMLSLILLCIPLFAQDVQIVPTTRKDAQASPIRFYADKGITIECGEATKEATTEQTYTIKYPDGSVSYVINQLSEKIAIFNSTYAPAPPLIDGSVSYQKIGHGFNSMAKGTDGGKEAHLKLQFQTKGDGGQIKVQAGDSEKVISFQYSSESISIAGQDADISDIQNAFSGSGFYRSALDALCAELKTHVSEWSTDFRTSLLMAMSIVFSNQFFDPTTIYTEAKPNLAVTVCGPAKVTVTVGGISHTYDNGSGCTTYICTTCTIVIKPAA